MVPHPPPLLLTATALLFQTHVILSTKLRPTYHIPRSGQECLLEKLHEKEWATFAVTITHGDKLKGSVIVKGPIAPDAAATTSEVEEYYERYRRGEKHSTKLIPFSERGGRGYDAFGNYIIKDVADFEHVRDYDPYYMDDEYMGDDDDYNYERDRRYNRARRGGTKRYGNRMDTWQETFQAKAAGWYIGCVSATYSEIYAEIDFRKASELGMADDGETVLTWEEHERLLHDQHIDEDAATEEDLQYARDKIKSLNKVVHKIREIQLEEQRRLEMHKAINERSHSRMVWGSVMETGIFIIVSFVQVMFIRRWFKDPILGM